MNRPELYKKTIDILYKAYFDDTLERGKCNACAVGNILRETAASLKIETRAWANTFITIINPKTGATRQIICEDDEIITHDPLFGHMAIKAFRESDFESLRNSRLLIQHAPYSLEELIQIEYAFETAAWSQSKEDQMYYGLAAVLDVLAQIHEVTDQDLITTNSKRFSEHYKTRLCTTNA